MRAASHADRALRQNRHEPFARRVLPARHLRQPDRLRHELLFVQSCDEHGHDLSRQRPDVPCGHDPALWHVAYAHHHRRRKARPGSSIWRAPSSSFRLRQRVRAPRSIEPKPRDRCVTACICHLSFVLGSWWSAGEWYSTCGSRKTGTAQEAAFRFYVTVLGVLIFVSLPDGDLAEPASSARRRRGDFL